MRQPIPKDARVPNSSGYVAAYNKDQRRVMLEHLSVWIANNGPIPDGHEIHHVNGIRTDNRIENLVALPRLEHKRLHSGCYRDASGQWIKPCRTCGQHIPMDNYYPRRKAGPGMVRSSCPACESKAASAWQRAKFAQRKSA